MRPRADEQIRYSSSPEGNPELCGRIMLKKKLGRRRIL